jgi:hypothetical protein
MLALPLKPNTLARAVRGACIASVKQLRESRFLRRAGNEPMPVHHHGSNNVSAVVEIEQIAREGRANSGGEQELNRHSAGFALQGDSGQAYNEEAFHYFLEIERKRCEISQRPFLLLLIDLRDPATGIYNSGPTAGKLLSILSRCLRDTDFVGWYREGRVVGAVLTQHGEPPRDSLSEIVRERVGGELRKHLPSDLVAGLPVRVYRLPPNVNVRSE